VDQFRSGQYLTFRVGRQEFAIEAGPVKAIIPAHDLVSTEHPNPAWLAGESHLRGEPFPVIDLRLKLKLRHGISGRTPSIVVVRAATPPSTEPRPSGSGQTLQSLIGFLADSVSEIIHARAHDFRNGKIRIGRPRQIVPLSQLTL
jgi:chemotaxis signal transduction protein